MVDKKIHHWKPKFLVISIGQGISIFTSSVIHMAIVWYLTEQTESAAILSLGTLLGFLPRILLGPFTGVIVDRYNKKTVMILSDLFIAVITLMLAVIGFLGELPIWLIMIVLFVRAIGSTFHSPALQATTPLIVPKGYLTRCAGYSQTFESISLLISPAVAAILYRIWDINTILLLDIAGAAFATLTISFIKIPSIKKKSSAKIANLIGEAKEGFDVLRKEQGMMSLLFISMLYALVSVPIGTLYPLISMSYFGASVGSASLVEVASSLGALIGSLILGWIGDRLNKIKTIRTSIAFMGIGLVSTGLLSQGGIKIFIVLAAMMGITLPFYYGTLTSIYQLRIKPEYLGRVLSLSSSMTMFAMPMGLILSGSFAEVIGVENWFLISGILTIIIALVCSLLPSLRNSFKSHEPENN